MRLIHWDRIMPLYSRLPDTFKRALPYLLASICYHESWLKETLSPDHQLFSTRLFASGDIAALKPHVLVGSNDCSTTGLRATGIPSHLAMANELVAVVHQTQQLKEAVLARCDGLPLVPVELTNVLLSKFSINGALPITMDNMKEMLNAMVAQLRSEMREVRVDEASPKPSLIPPSSDSRFQLWLWGGRLHMVPEGWTLPSSLSLKDTWHLWHFGHLADRIGPLRGLRKFDLSNAAQATQWAKTKQTMQAIAQVMVDERMVGSLQEVLTLSEADSTAYFDRAVVVWMEQLKEGVTRGNRRWMEMKIPTVYALMMKSRKRRREVEETESDGSVTA